MTKAVGKITQLTQRPSPEWLQGQKIAAQIAAEEEEKVEAIKFLAAVAKVMTVTDGGIRVVLDLDEKGCQVMRVLAECQQNGVALKVEAVPQP